MMFEQLLDGNARQSESGADFMAAVQTTQTAGRGFLEHRKVSIDKRRAALASFSEILSSEAASLESLLCSRLGYPPSAASLELREAIAIVKAHLEEIKTASLPLGPCLILGSWSSPVLRVAQTVAAALVQGNAVILLTSVAASAIYVRLGKILIQAGFAPALISVIATDDKETQEVLFTHPAVRAVHAACHHYEGELLRSLPFDFSKKRKYYFGGHNPVIFLHDAPLVVLPELVRRALEYHLRGEERFTRWFVQEKNYAIITEEIKKILPTLSAEDLGQFPNEEYKGQYLKQMGAMVKERSWFTKPGEPLIDERTAHLQAALDFNNCSPWQQREVLGPVLTVTRFKNSQEAVKFVNTTNYASAAAVFSASSEKAKEVGVQLTMPQLYINQLPEHYQDKPIHAVGDSGVGAQVSDLDFFRFTQIIY